MSRFTRTNVLLVVITVVLVAVPLVFGLGRGEEPFAGSDDQAEARIAQIDPGYEPWFSSLFEPPSQEVESGLFALQAALGAGVLGYCFGVLRTRRRAVGGPAADPAPPEPDRAA